MFSAAPLLVLGALAAASPAEPLDKRACVGTISSLSDVTAAQACTTININSFTVPAGSAFNLAAPTGATVNLLGKLTFGVANIAGPLFKLTGTNVTFNGNGNVFDGQGAKYWDGLGGNGGVVKPAPMLRFQNSGKISNLNVLNTPARAISVGNSAPLVITGVNIDNSAGDVGDLGHNTDCWDVSSTGGLTITGGVCKNQDDCLAINKGSDITFSNMQCSGGHGISVGSIDSSITVKNVLIANNVITNNDQALRIKTKSASTGSTVSNVTFTGNKATGSTKFGVIIDQSYPSTNGTPGTGVIVSGVKFTGTNTIAVASSATRVLINCGSTTSCPGTWDLSGLTVTGGKASSIKNVKVSGGSY